MMVAAWWQWAALFVWATIPLPSTILGIVGLNILAVGALGASWFLWPGVGAPAYTATWMNLVGYRLLFGGRMRIRFPMTVNNQNGASSWLIVLGVLGAIRSGFGADGLGVTLGIVGAAVLFFSQGPLFQPAQ